MHNVFRTIFMTTVMGLAISGPVDAHAQTSIPLCTTDAPDCIVGNWGQIDPEGLESNARSTFDTVASSRISIRPMTVAMASEGSKKPTVKAVASPVNFAPKETAALIAAIKRARFTKDGAIVSGDRQIAAASEAAMKKAGKTYVLTLYVKAPPTLKPDAAQSLTARVKSVNGVLNGTSEKPRS